VAILYLTTVLSIPGDVCELFIFFLIQTLSSLDLDDAIFMAIYIYIYIYIFISIVHTLQTDLYTNT